MPIRAGEPNTDTFAKHLSALLPTSFELILSRPDVPKNRAYALNSGAKQAKGSFLWFLHVDTRVEQQNIEKLVEAIDNLPDCLHYFRLLFYPSSFLLKINSVGANLRSYFLHCPYGDQGLCISKEKFFQLGMYNETAAYGEDHLFVWTSRQNGVRLNEITSYLKTSDRKYRTQGWLKVTLLHHYLFWKQAIPEGFKLVWNKFRFKTTK